MTKLTADINLTSSLAEKIWTTLTHDGLGGLLAPWQIKRVKKAKTEARVNKVISIAQAEKHAADILAGRKELLADGSLVDSRPLDDEQAVLRALEAPQRAMLISRSLNLAKTVEYLMSGEVDSQTSVSEEPISRDWFTHWRMHAETFSEEHYQRLWAAVLAGEVRQPRSYSIAAMDILASISVADAERFQLLCNMSFSNRERTIILLAVPGWHDHSSHHHLKNPSNTMGEQLVGYGIEHFHLLSMRTIGLLASLPEEEYPEWDVLLGDDVDYAGHAVTLQPKITEGRISAISFTEAGHQLRRLINKHRHQTYTPALQSLFAEAQVVMKFQ